MYELHVTSSALQGVNMKSSVLYALNLDSGETYTNPNPHTGVTVYQKSTHEKLVSSQFHVNVYSPFGPKAGVQKDFFVFWSCQRLCFVWVCINSPWLSRHHPNVMNRARKVVAGIWSSCAYNVLDRLALFYIVTNRQFFFLCVLVCVADCFADTFFTNSKQP